MFVAALRATGSPSAWADRAINAVCSPLLRQSPVYGGDRIGVDL